MSENRDLFVFYVAMAIAAVLLLAGCDQMPFGYTSIKEVTAAPAQFEGREIKLKGKVSNVTKLPLLDLKAYTLRDDGGEITVSTQGTLPAVNETVGLRGTVRSTAIIGGQSLGLRVEEIRRF